MRRNTLPILCLLAIACGGSSRDPSSASGSPPNAVHKSLSDVGLDAASLDKSIDPCSDFFQYACGGWLDSAEIPGDKSTFGRFSEIADRNEALLKEILDTALASEPGSISPALVRVRDYYGACMDEKAIADEGNKPIRPLMAAIKKTRSREALVSTLSELHRHGIWALWSLEADADFKDSTQTILFVDQAGLGLPDRDYYIKDEKKMRSIRTFYADHIKRMFRAAGRGNVADAASKAVMQIETRLAKASKSATERRDPKSLYNKVDRVGLAKLVPSIDWSGYFKSVGDAPELDGISVTSKNFLEQVESELKATPLPALRHYLTWHVLRSTASLLDTRIDTEAFALTKKLSGQKEQRPRWKRCLSAANSDIGELLAQEYIARAFPGESKPAAATMVRAISQAFQSRLLELPWMTDATKAKAEGKRSAMAFLIGYPDKWKTYDFEIVPTSYAENSLRASAWEIRRRLGKVGKPYDRSEWHMVPQIVNAYYNPLANQMVFPAGILQKPFFDANASAAVNLGGMGMIVGHELTHGFDDMGSQFAADGNMKNWWQKEDFDRFKAKGECVIAQYASYAPLEDRTINGKLTLGENIADIGGVRLAYRAYRTLREGKQPVVADGFTEDQQFFLAVGQAWCTKYRDEALLNRLVTDPHSPAKYRVNGSLVNQPEFAEAFSCDSGANMNPKTTCDVW